MKFGCKAFRFGDQVVAQEASFECFFKELQEKSGNLWPFSKPAKRKQSLYCKILKKDDEYVFAGIILSEALRKKGFSREGDKVEEIKLNAGSEINIFALRLSNFKGLYGGYRGAVTTNKFLTQLWGEYINFVRNKRNACQEDEEFSNASSRFREFSFRKKANSSQLVSDKNFRQMLSNLRSVKEIHFSTVGYDSSIMKWGRSLGDRVTSCRHSLRLDLVEKSAVMGALREAFDACSRITGSGQKKIGGVKGVDSDNNTIDINFDEFCQDYFTTADINTTLRLDEIEKYPGIEVLSCQILNSHNLLLQ